MIRVIIIGAGARGNRVFADLIENHATGFTLAGVVEPDAARRAAFQRTHSIPDRAAFASLKEFLAAPRLGEIAFICTPDPTHFELCKAVSQKGYDVLLEKPIATNLPDCLALLEVERACRNRIIVAHVLRYSPFFRRIKEILGSGQLGAVRHVDLAENVGHWHFAHSYVRGNWRRADTSAPIILTKSCHDLDILHWLLGERVVSVSSYGSLTYFTSANAPPGAADRCVDCPHRETCLFSATRFYLQEQNGWPYDVLADSVEYRQQGLVEGPYGRCVYHNDNDVCDNQVVTLEFASGALGMFGLHAHTARNTRKITILCDHGEIRGDVRANTLEISRFTGQRDELHEERISLPGEGDSHGGGDLGLLYVLHEHLSAGGHDELVTSLQSSLTSHVLAFLAEESRVHDNRKVPVPEIFAPGQVGRVAAALAGLGSKR